MTPQNLDDALLEVRRFYRAAHKLQNACPEVVGHDQRYRGAPLEQGALKRISMDLTRALAKLRKGS